MNGLKTIIFAIIGICLALAIVAWGSWTYINTTDNQPFIRNILRQVDEISKFPQLLKSKQSEIENILSLIEVLERPITQEFISKLSDGIVPNLDLDPFIGASITDITAAIRNEIASMGNNLGADIVREIRAYLRRFTAFLP